MSTPRKFRAGDVVKHGPTGETWVLGTDEEAGRVYPLGWPETIALASNCDLIRAAEDEERLAILTRLSQIDGCDYRKSVASFQLLMEDEK